MSLLLGWTCSRCTYRHRAPAPRCAMCNELRNGVSKQEMQDFVLTGKRPSTNDDSNSHCDDAMMAAETPASLSLQQQQQQETRKKKLVQATVVVLGGGAGATNEDGTNEGGAVRTTAVAAFSGKAQEPWRKTATSSNPYTRPKTTSSGCSSSLSGDHHDLPSKAAPSAPNAANSGSESTEVSRALLGTALPKSNPSSIRPSKSTRLSGKNAKTARSITSSSSILPYQSGPVPLATDGNADRWIFPVHEEFPKRQYQLEMAETALFNNTLVSLPTGLGKTLIAAVVLYNYYTWFPTGKVIFMAPTLPLVHQQVKACHDIMGIPAKDTAVLTGKTNATRRAQIWNDRRVFFCTPQTVQKDLEAAIAAPSSTSCFASVVCIVLDEAHKATGEYAYVQVVTGLEAAGAKFRILGLSATPGTNIKAIQMVIDALRINKIEARQESDPSVAPYIHERKSEIVLVPQASASRELERCLNDIIAPILDRLRQAGASNRLIGSATVTAFHILKAREEFFQRAAGAHGGGSDQGMMGFFLAAHTFVQLRSDLHKHGVGMLRTKLNRLRTERQRGLVASIVKGNDFARLWQMVMDATTSTAADGVTSDGVHDKLRNNPKLTKLREILVEHFEREQARGSSSRAIVFSQFRDSVSEIVSVLAELQPLIRPRHFVGQGKGGKSEKASGQLKGMTQAEQHQVIREFRSDVYNVLVCTCIGEEGLDIGEVDLIINFDTLRSPIRMIQRTGRTGRKRSGRVVCLVAEGPEEKTLVASKQSERNLFHALKNPNSFKCLPTIPMFPKQPVLCERNMTVARFHMSQVEGHASNRGGERAAKRSRNESDYRLTAEQQAIHRAVFGELQFDYEICDNFPSQLRRRFLLARRHSKSACKSAAVLSRLLHSMETFSEVAEDTVRSSTLVLGGSIPRITRGFPSSSTTMDDLLFPIHADGHRLDSISVATLLSNNHDGVGSTSTMLPWPQRDVVPTHSERPAAGSALANDTIESVGQPVATTNAIVQAVDTLQERCVQVQTKIPVPFPSSDPEELKYNYGAKDDEFVLPTPPESSSSSGESDTESDVDDEERNAKKTDAIVLRPPIRNSCATDRTKCEVGVVLDCKVLSSTVSSAHRDKLDSNTFEKNEDEFQLPSQDSSSSDDDSECQSSASHQLERDVRPLVESCHAKSLAPISTSHHSERDLIGLRYKEQMLKVQNDTRDVVKSDRRVSFGNEQVLDSVPTKSRKRTIRAILDTPDSESNNCDSSAIRAVGKGLKVETHVDRLTDTPASFEKTLQESTHSDPLTNTPLKTDTSQTLLAEDIVCQICLGVESTDEDPIILCDGFNNEGKVCNLAVHTSCYSVNVSSDPEEEWRCDPCEYRRRNNQKLAVCCLSCGKASGALRRVGPEEFEHVGGCPVPPVPHNKENIPQQQDSNLTEQERRRRRRRIAVQRFVHLEADIDSDEDMDGDDEEVDQIRDIEDEEAFHNSFINDTSQLGYTQDALDAVDPDNDNIEEEEEAYHRAVDMEKERQNHFTTPILNRRLKRKRERGGQFSDTPPSMPRSVRGLGDMHFIRSVIEHHKNGGRAEDIEEFYEQLEEEEGGNADAEQLVPESPFAEKKVVVLCDDSDSD